MDGADSGRAETVRRALGEHEGPLVLYAARLLGDVHRARDVVQEAFLRLCAQDLAELDGRMRPWLFTVVRRLALDVLRKEDRMLTPGEAALDARNGRETDPAETAATRDDADRARELLAGLPPNQREVLELRFRHGLRYREIAEVTGLSLGNVGFLVHTGLVTLRARLGTETRRAAGGAR